MLTGGGCKLCGSVEHFKKDCPEKQNAGELQGCGVAVGPAGLSYCSAQLWSGKRLWEESLEAAEVTFRWDTQGGCGGGTKLHCKTKIIFVF